MPQINVKSDLAFYLGSLNEKTNSECYHISLFPLCIGNVLKASVLLTNQSGYTGCKHIVVRYYRTTTLLGACLLCTKVETFSWCWFCHERLNGESRQDHIEHKSKALFSFQTNWRAYITWQMPLANCNAFII